MFGVGLFSFDRDLKAQVAGLAPTLVMLLAMLFSLRAVAVTDSPAGSASSSLPASVALSTSARQPAKTIYRHDLFTSVLNHLSSVFETASDQEFTQTLTPIELDHFRALRKIVVQQNWYDRDPIRRMDGQVFRIRFETEQAYFRLQEGAPVRTAVAGNGSRDDILVNELIVSDPANAFRIGDVVQLLIHELGHRLPNQNQQAVDSLAAKIRKNLETRIERIQLNGTSWIEVMTLPTWDFDGRRPDLDGRSLLVFRETPEVVEDISGVIENFFSKVFRLQSNNYFSKMDLRRRMQWMQHREMNAHDGTPIIRARIARAEKLVGESSFALNPYAEAARSVEDHHEIEIDFDRSENSGGQIRQMRLRKTYEALTETSISQLESRWLDKNRIQFTAELNSPAKDGRPNNPAGSLQLLVAIDGGEVEVAGQRGADSSRWTFDLTLPDKVHSPCLKVTSAVMNNAYLVMADKGVQIDMAGRYSDNVDATKLHSILLKTPLGNKPLSQGHAEDPRVSRGAHKLKFVFTGTAPIHELRIAWGRSWKTYDPGHDVQQNGFGLYRGPRGFQEPEGLRVDYDIAYYTADKFQQAIEKGHRVVELEVTDDISNLYSDRVEQYHVGGWGFANPGYNQTVQTVIGHDTGHRFIAEIEAVDAHFNRVLMQPEDHLYYSIDDRAHVTAEARAKEIEEEKQKRWRDYYNSFDHSLTPDTGFQHESCEALFN